MFPLNPHKLVEIMPRAAPVIGRWVKPFEEAMQAFGIDTPRNAAWFFANIAHESIELTALEENLRYSSVARLRQVFPRFFPDDEIAARYIKAGPEAIANRVYADRLGNGGEISGDGWAYRARGPVGLTFKSNYIACSLAICRDIDTLLKNPELIVDPEFGAASAAWYWAQAKCSESAANGDFDGCCDLVNIGRKTIAQGDSNGFADREQYRLKAERAFGVS
jgi:putative chitinase